MKTIMIKDQVYKKLAKIKGKRSFSELLDSLAESDRTAKMAAFEKLRGILTDKEAKGAYREIAEMRKQVKVRVFEATP